jgi:ferric-dicitrate binding protein FerR (iron transport regulator)
VEKGTKLLAVLEPNHQVTYTIPSDLAKEQKVDANAVVTNWAKEDMVFDQTPFGDIASILSRRYGTTIRFKNPDTRSCKLKAYFNGTETLEKVLEQLCTISNAKYTRDSEGQIVIDGPGCS